MDSSDVNEILTIAISIAGTIGGTVLGWWLNKKSSQKEKEPKLSFLLAESQNKDDLIPPEQRTKYSKSGYEVVIYNLGLTPVIIDCFGIYYKNEIVTDALEIKKTLAPYDNVAYELTQQEFNNICEYCRKEDMKKSDIIVFDVANKTITGTLDVELLNAEIKMKDSIYTSLTGKTRQ